MQAPEEFEKELRKQLNADKNQAAEDMYASIRQYERSKDEEFNRKRHDDTAHNLGCFGGAISAAVGFGIFLGLCFIVYIFTEDISPIVLLLMLGACLAGTPKIVELMLNKSADNAREYNEALRKSLERDKESFRQQKEYEKNAKLVNLENVFAEKMQAYNDNYETQSAELSAKFAASKAVDYMTSKMLPNVLKIIDLAARGAEIRMIQANYKITVYKDSVHANHTGAPLKHNYPAELTSDEQREEYKKEVRRACSEMIFDFNKQRWSSLERNEERAALARALADNLVIKVSAERPEDISGSPSNVDYEVDFQNAEKAIVTLRYSAINPDYEEITGW